MANEWAFVQGKLKWCKLVQPDMKYGKWSVVVYPNNESLEKIRALQSEGIKNVIKKDDEGYFTTFSRPIERTQNSKKVGMAPPIILQADGKTPLVGVAIGNGSDGTVKLEVYQHAVPGGTKKAKAARLYSVRIDNLIPFEKSRDFDSEQKLMVEGLSEQPEQLF